MNFKTIYKPFNQILHCTVASTTWWGLFSRSCLVFTIGYSYSMAGSAWRRRCGGSCHCMTACACISFVRLAIFARPRPFAVFTKNCELSFNGKKAYCAILRIGIAKLHALTAATLAPPGVPPFLKGPMGGNPIRLSTQ